MLFNVSWPVLQLTSLFLDNCKTFQLVLSSGFSEVEYFGREDGGGGGVQGKTLLKGGGGDGERMQEGEILPDFLLPSSLEIICY